ncbi:MAG: hypothetical protein R3E79_53025 [Caldilineaceae bacterium]
MQKLRDIETQLRQNLTPSENDLDAAINAATNLLDMSGSLDTTIIEGALHHFIIYLQLRFPSFMSMHQAALVDKLQYNLTDDKKRKLKAIKLPASSSTDAKGNDNANTNQISTDSSLNLALPADYQSTFVANVQLGNGGSIARLDVADDRPLTRFGYLQRSHTVAWSFLRTHLQGFRGKKGEDLITFVKNELRILKLDLENTDLEKQADELLNKMNSLSNFQNEPRHVQQKMLSELVESYVTLYQRSESATYGKEERPSSHGEGPALETLGNLEKKLENTAPTTDDRKDALNAALRLVDASIGTGSLPPQNWLRAVSLWYTLLGETYPKVMTDLAVGDALLKELEIMGSDERLLAGYDEKNLSQTDKIVITMYEIARQDLNSIDANIAKAIKQSLQLRLHMFPIDDDTFKRTVIRITTIAQKELTEAKNRVIERRPA